MLSGGSCVSWSVTSAANTVTLHVSPVAKSVVGSSVKVTGPPETVALWLPLVAHEIEYQPSTAFTGSLKVIEMFESTATFVAPFAGVVLATVGAVSPLQLKVGERRFRGVGAPATKSLALLSVSWQPLLLRSAAVVFERVGAGAAPS